MSGTEKDWFFLDQDNIEFVCNIEAMGHTRDDFCQDVEEGEWKCWSDEESLQSSDS